MRNSLFVLTLLATAISSGAFHVAGQTPRSGNPILAGWYADPEAHIFENVYWIYPTYSAPYPSSSRKKECLPIRCRSRAA
jgi:hypothetical protein